MVCVYCAQQHLQRSDFTAAAKTLELVTAVRTIHAANLCHAWSMSPDTKQHTFQPQLLCEGGHTLR